MKIPHRRSLLGLAAALIAVGCAGSPVQQQVGEISQGALIWTGMRTRCHNRRSAPEFTAEQWPIIVSHMRTLSDLTRSEAQDVASFLRRLREPANLSR